MLSSGICALAASGVIFPKWSSVHYYFRKWKADGTLESLNTGLNILERKRVGREESPSMMSIDTQSVKAAPFVDQDKGTDGNKRVNGRKRHVITDTQGLVGDVVLHAAHQADGVMAERVVEPLQGYLHRMQKILADERHKAGPVACRR